jgi:signal transduction histidine kinase
VLAATVWSLLLLAVAAVLLSSIYRQSVERNFDARLHVYLKTLVASAKWDGAGVIESVGNVGEPRFETLFSGWYWQIRELGTKDPAVFASRSLWVERLPLPSEQGIAADAENIREGYGPGPQQEPLRIVERVITFGEPGRAYSFTVAGDAAELEQDVADFRVSVVWALGLLGAAFAATTLFQVRFGLRPLADIGRQLGAIRSGAAQRLIGEFPVEINVLVKELNALIDSNNAIVERARTHVGNLAHALKTPLSVIANEAARSRTVFARKVEEQAAIMRDQIARHLERARMAARANVIGVVTEVRPALEALMRAMEKIHGERAIAASLSCPASIRFAGERQDFDEIAGNLIDNAFKWANSRISIDVETAPGKKGGRMRLVIDDDGPGLNSEDRSEVLRRGARVDETIPGTGLGLAIVSELVQLYDGAFALSTSPAGGLRVEVELPVSDENA